MSTSTIGLADAIDNLRRELTEATKRGEDQALRFNVDGIELELAVEIAREGGGGGKVSFKVLGSGVDISGKEGMSHSNIHRVKISLKPAKPGETKGAYQVDDDVEEKPNDEENVT